MKLLTFLSLKPVTLGGKRDSGRDIDTKITIVGVPVLQKDFFTLIKSEDMPEELEMLIACLTQ